MMRDALILAVAWAIVSTLACWYIMHTAARERRDLYSRIQSSSLREYAEAQATEHRATPSRDFSRRRDSTAPESETTTQPSDPPPDNYAAVQSYYNKLMESESRDEL